VSPAVVLRPTHQRERRGEPVEVRPAHLEVPLAGPDEPGSPAQDPGVVENEAVSRPEQEGQHLAGPPHHLGEGPVSGVEHDDLVGRQPRRLHVRPAEPDLPDPAARIDTDHRPGGTQLGPGVGVGEGHLAAGQHGERGGIPGAQRSGRVETVDEGGRAALRGIVQAVQDLQGGQRIPEGLSGARRHRPAGERLVARQRTVLYVNERPALRLPHQPDSLRHAQHRTRLAGHVPEHDEPLT
jgi:hypothetical protein